MRFFTLLIVLIFTLFACQSNSSSGWVLDAAQIEATDSVVAVSVKPTQHLVPAEAQNAASKSKGSIHQPSKIKRQVPFPQLLESAQRFMADADLGDSLYFETGTEVHIPLAAFLLANGKVATGKVQLYFDEWHTLKDIFLSGIPMHYTENGEEGALSSAGMFEIYAQQNGKDLRVNPQAPIVVQVASRRKEGDFMNLDFNPSTQEWKRKSKAADPFPKVQMSTFTHGFLKEVNYHYVVHIEKEAGRPKQANLTFEKWNINRRATYKNELSPIRNYKFQVDDHDFTGLQNQLFELTGDSSGLETGAFRMDDLEFTKEGKVVMWYKNAECTLSVKPIKNQGLTEVFYPNFLRNYKKSMPYYYRAAYMPCYSYQGKEYIGDPITKVWDYVLRPFFIDGFGFKNIDKFVQSPTFAKVIPYIQGLQEYGAATYYLFDLDNKVIFTPSAASIFVNQGVRYTLIAMENEKVFVADSILIGGQIKAGEIVPIEFVPKPVPSLMTLLEQAEARVKP